MKELARVFGCDDHEWDSIDRKTTVQNLSDIKLLECHSLLKGTTAIIDTVWLPLIEAEMSRRGLAASH